MDPDKLEELLKHTGTSSLDALLARSPYLARRVLAQDEEITALRQRVEAAKKMAEMLEKAIPWIGYQAHVPDILECSRRVLADFRATGGEG